MADGDDDFKDGVTKFDKSKLKPSKVVVKDVLPTKEDIKQAKEDEKKT